MDISMIPVYIPGYKYAWVIPIKDKKGASIVNAFKKIISEGGNQIKYGLIKVVTFIINLLKIF